MSLTCSSSAAMCLPRSANFSTSTCSGTPLAMATSAAGIQRSGRYAAVAASETRVTRPSTRSISICICSSRLAGTSSAPSQTIQRMPSSSPMPISAQASTSGSMRATSPRSIADSSAAT